MKIDGTCHCGRIRYTAEIDPDGVVICHCTDCQALTGSAFRAVVRAPAASFELSGEPRIYVKTSERGVKRAHAFCGNCGSPMYSTSVDDHGPKLYGIRIGTCRQRHELHPARQVWCRSALPWVGLLGGLPKSEQG